MRPPQGPKAHLKRHKDGGKSQQLRQALRAAAVSQPQLAGGCLSVEAGCCEAACYKRDRRAELQPPVGLRQLLQQGTTRGRERLAHCRRSVRRSAGLVSLQYNHLGVKGVSRVCAIEPANVCMLQPATCARLQCMLPRGLLPPPLTCHMLCLIIGSSPRCGAAASKTSASGRAAASWSSAAVVMKLLRD